MGRPNRNGLPEYLRQRKDGSYYLDFYLIREDGTKQREREDIGSISRTLAKSIRDRRVAELAKKDFKLLPPKMTFRRAGEAFLAYSQGRKRSYKADVMLIAKLTAHFGDRPLEVLNPAAMEVFLNIIKEKGKRVIHRKGEQPQWKPFKPATLNRYIACAKTIVNRALANGQIDRNTLAGVKLFKENNARDRVLDREEYVRLLAECPDYLRLIIRLAYTLGMRRGEILGLRWDQVDLKKGVIRLAGEDTKTAVAREVPLDQGFMDALTAFPRVLRCPYVFANQGRSIASVKTAFNSACARAGIENFRFHDLRHCAVTNLRKAGVATSTIMSISGHKTDAMLRRYDRVDTEDRKAALERVRQFYGTGLAEDQKTA